jgi:hypothetical protein
MIKELTIQEEFITRMHELSTLESLTANEYNLVEDYLEAVEKWQTTGSYSNFLITVDKLIKEQ